MKLHCWNCKMTCMGKGIYCTLCPISEIGDKKGLKHRLQGNRFFREKDFWRPYFRYRLSHRNWQIPSQLALTVVKTLKETFWRKVTTGVMTSSWIIFSQTVWPWMLIFLRKKPNSMSHLFHIIKYEDIQYHLKLSKNLFYCQFLMSMIQKEHENDKYGFRWNHW